jgi:uncharacterized membrane protein YsdA (DUF1294 family)
MVLTFTVVLLGMFFIIPTLRKNNFYMLHTAIVILAAYFVENNYFITTPFHKKTFLLLLVFHLISINLVTFIAYGTDKKAAKSKDWRIPESNLHTLEVLGGWAGAILGQKIFRHKTNKRSYQNFFWLLMIVEITTSYVILKFLNII